MQPPSSNVQYPKSKLLILALLSINAVAYAVVDTLTSTVDATTWLILLVLYELETYGNRLPVTEKALGRARTALIMLIVWVFFSYFNDSEWLDVANSLLWFALIALMELEVRRPELVIRHATACWILTVGIFTGLLAMAGIWLWQQAWLDAYDALLWITAFGFIEADLVQLLKRKQPASNANG